MHSLHILRGNIRRVRIELLERTLDGLLDQRLQIDLVHIGTRKQTVEFIEFRNLLILLAIGARLGKSECRRKCHHQRQHYLKHSMFQKNSQFSQTTEPEAPRHI